MLSILDYAEVMKVLKAKKYAKMKEQGVPELAEKPTVEGDRATDNRGAYQEAESSDIGKEKKTDLQVIISILLWPRIIFETPGDLYSEIC